MFGGNSEYGKGVTCFDSATTSSLSVTRSTVKLSLSGFTSPTDISPVPGSAPTSTSDVVIVLFVEMYTFAKLRHISEIPEIMPKPVTIRDPYVHLKVDMSDPRVSESMVPPHFTNIQASLSLARRVLGASSTPNRQIMLITDGLPTAHYEDETLYMLYPAHPLTEEATIMEDQPAGKKKARKRSRNATAKAKRS